MRCSAVSASALGLVAGLWLTACGEPVAPPRVPVRLVVSASDTIRAAGGTLGFSAVAEDSAGAAVPGVAIGWSVGNTRFGQITSGGVFTAGPDAGRVYVRATVGAPPLAESLAVRVVAPGTVKWTWAAAEVGGIVSEVNGISQGALSFVPGVALDPGGNLYLVVSIDPVADLARLVSLDPAGRVRWIAELVQTEGNYPIVTPGGDVLVVSERVSLFGPDGTVRWERVTDASDPTPLAGASSDELVLAAHVFHLTAYRLATGDSLWQSPRGGWLVPPTLVGRSHAYAKNVEGDTLFVFRQSDGAILKTFVDPDTGVDKAVFGTGTVPVGERFYLPTAFRLAAFDTAGLLLWLTDDHARGTTEPVIGPDGTLYIQSRRWGLEALNPDGSTKWYRRTAGFTGGWGEEPRWPWHGGPALAAGGLIYLAGRDAFHAYDTEGMLRWRFVADSTPGPSGFPLGAFVGAPAIAPDGTVYSFTATHVYAFYGPAGPEPNSPWPMWRHDAQRTGWVR